MADWHPLVRNPPRRIVRRGSFRPAEFIRRCVAGQVSQRNALRPKGLGLEAQRFGRTLEGRGTGLHGRPLPRGERKLFRLESTRSEFIFLRWLFLARRDLRRVRSVSKVMSSSTQQSSSAPRAATLQPAPYVTIALAATITGLSEKAIRRKIEDGKWLEGREYMRSPDGGIFISMRGFTRWVEKATV